MASAISLIQMPNVVMKNILEYLEFPSILVLRKTCHDLRNFIVDTKPASHLTRIDVRVKPESISCNLCLRGIIFIRYVKNGEGCSVKNYRIKEEIERQFDEDFVTVFCKDFEIILRHQKTVLEEFRIDFISLDSRVKERVLENVNKSLKSLKHLLQVESLYMEVNNHNEILSILPYIEPKTLEYIDINDYLGRFNTVLNLDEIGQLEQWKQAKILEIKRFLLPDLSQNVKHFKKITFQFRHFQIETLVWLKEIFLGSLTLCKIIIDYSIRSSDENRHILIETFGQPFLDTNQFENWFFKTTDTNFPQFLRISLKYNSIFSIVLNNQMYLRMLEFRIE